MGFLQGQQYSDDGTALEQRNGNPLIFTKTLPGLTGNNKRLEIRVVKYHPKTDLTTMVKFYSATLMLI